ncbi:MAG: hypothetical protein V1740_00220 [Candidatus Woesearchaeota archaeon]
MIRNSRGQVTVYIIVGIVLLVVVAGVLFVRTQTQGELGGSESVLVKEIPLEFRSIYFYVEQCMLSTTVDGLKLLGMHGGYIDPVASGKLIGSEPTEGSAVNFLTEANVPVAYWYYLESGNACVKDCSFSFGFPNLRKSDGEPSIETDLQNYIDNNIRTCLNGFESFKDQGYTFENELSYKSDVTVGDKGIIVRLDYPLNADNPQGSHKFSSFFTSLPLDLGRIYDLSRLLTEHQANYNYLEKHLANLIVGFSGLDKNIPPMADVTVDFGGGETWVKSGIEKSLQAMMESNIPLFQVQNTRNFKQRAMPSETLDALYNRGTNIPNDLATNDLNVYFSYFKPDSGWDTYFDLNCRGSACGPMSVSSNLVALIGIQRYKFFYDVSNPVLIEINAPDQLTNYIENGYRFKFFLESNLRDNHPMTVDYEQLLGGLGTTSFFCDADKRNTGNISVDVKDASSKKGIEGVSVVYTCGPDSCIVGETDEDGELTERFPVCFGGIVTFLNPDYSDYSLPFNTNIDQEKSLDITLSGMKEKKVTLKKKMLVKSGESWELGTDVRALESKEEAFITFKRFQELTDQPYTAFVGLTAGSGDTVTLTPGTYAVDISLYLNESVSIPGSEQGSLDIPGLDLTEPPSGGLKLNFTITEQDMEKDTINLYAIGVDPRTFTSVGDLGVISDIEGYSKKYKSQLQPEFS